MQITYVGHSGFYMELENVLLLFDYYKGELPEFPAAKGFMFSQATAIRIILILRFFVWQRRRKIPFLFCQAISGNVGFLRSLRPGQYVLSQTNAVPLKI